ncbi:LysR substrate-binding domain-containing protein [Variovorax sp. Root411]|uniref:LysR substrate-binding domain-containing protein n=1 Tax=Variovorax sp. Root411 TaxID=1736530 RepID=UPI0006FAE981|nr:LysR substrate-binding domain-containing protein [Variovorax sp. Root411]KQW56420.1 LysR family transcriptional regulator [Variovorax sp. Root411]
MSPSTRIPSLTALRAYEAVVRFGSMTRAAEELCVTHSAISKQVQLLEEEFGQPLLRRLARSVEPTPEGARLAATLSAAFGLISAGIEQIRPGPLAVSCSASIMMRWLIPRLAQFKARHPTVELTISADHGPLDLLRDGIGVAIRNDVVKPPQDVIVRPMMREWFGPVCSPEYAQKIGLATPQDLSRANLLGTGSRPQAWNDWREAVGSTQQAVVPSESFEHFYLVLHAAACGLGVAIAPRFLVEDDLQSGRLIAPFGFVEGLRQVVLWLAPNVRTRADIRAFADWLEAEFRESRA